MNVRIFSSRDTHAARDVTAQPPAVIPDSARMIQLRYNTIRSIHGQRALLSRREYLRGNRPPPSLYHSCATLVASEPTLITRTSRQ
jgi:hypothetical protein